MNKKPIHTLEQIESELIFDRELTGETATERLQRESFKRLTPAVLRLAKAFDELGEVADRKAAEFRDRAAWLRLEAELDEMEGENG